jgi:alpha-mannosidase
MTGSDNRPTPRGAAADQTIKAAVARLRAHADEVEGGWIPTSWRLADSDAELVMAVRENHFGRVGIFEALPVRPGETVTVTTRLDLPVSMHQVLLADEPLFLTADGTYPIDVFVDGQRVFGDDLPIVASGPALIQLRDRVVPGDNGELRFDISFADAAAAGNGPHLNLTVRLSTPGLIRRHELLDASYARLLLAADLAVTDDEHDAVHHGSSLVPEELSSLTGAEIEQLSNALRAALAPVAERVESFTVHCVAHSHIDLAWLWTWKDTREVIKRDARSVLGLMDEFKDFRFTHSQPATYALLEAEEPELFGAVLERIAEGRWEVAAMQWVEGDTNLASGPAQARQVLEGVAYSREHLGVQPTVWLAPDTFGHAGNIPQLAASGGARTYYHHRGNPGRLAGGPLWPAYWWEGDDGSRLLAVSTPVYLGPLTAGRVARDVLALGHAPGLLDVCYFYGAGDHGGGPTRQSFERLIALQDQPGLPRIVPSTLGAYRDAVAAQGAILPIHRGESMTVFEGCYTSHADTKRWNREGENRLTTAETLSAAAGIDATDDLTPAWRSVLFNQFHDIIDGSAIHEAYADQADDFAAIAATADRVTAKALDRLEATAVGDGLAVTNPLAVPRRDLITIPDAPEGDLVAVDAEGATHTAQRTADGSAVFVASIPALATRRFALATTDEAATPLQTGHRVGGSYQGAAFLTVDTKHFYVQVREDAGVITTLFDKRVGKELVGHASARGESVEQIRPDLGLGVFHVLHEHPHEMSSWVVDDIYEERSLIRGARTRIVEHGPVRLVIETVHHFGASTLTSRMTFFAELARIDIDTTIDWQESGGPTDGVPSVVMSFGSRQDDVEAWYETPFAAARRPADGLVVPALRWADVGNDQYGIAVLNDSKYGYDALGSRLRVHLVRSSYEPDPIPEVGRIDRTRLSVVPHVGSWREAGIVAAAAGANQPLLVRAPGPSTASTPSPFRPRIEGLSTAVIAGLRIAHDRSGRVVTIYEAAGAPSIATVSGLPYGAMIWELSGADDRIRSFPAGDDGTVALSLGRFEVRNLLVEERYFGRSGDQA